MSMTLLVQLKISILDPSEVSSGNVSLFVICQFDRRKIKIKFVFNVLIYMHFDHFRYGRGSGARKEDHQYSPLTNPFEVEEN